MIMNHISDELRVQNFFFSFLFFCLITNLLFNSTPIFFSEKSKSTFHSKFVEIFSLDTHLFFLYNPNLIFIHLPWFYCWNYSTYHQTPIFFSLQSYSTFHSYWMILLLSLFYLSSNTHLFSTILFYVLFILHDFMVETSSFHQTPILFFSPVLFYFFKKLHDFIVETVFYL